MVKLVELTSLMALDATIQASMCAASSPDPTVPSLFVQFNYSFISNFVIRKKSN